MTRAKNILPTSATSGQLACPRVGIAFRGARSAYGREFFFFVDALILSGLRQADISVAEPLGLYRPAFSVHTYQVRDWRAGVGALRSMADNRGLLLSAQIAWLDNAEDVWRTVWAMQAAPFERFLAAEHVAAFRAEVEEWARDLARMNLLLQQLAITAEELKALSLKCGIPLPPFPPQ